MRSEAALRADFSEIRYAQVWEDADVLLDGLDVRPGHACLSIASAGDNALALLTRGPARVVALDLSPAQLACLELRVAAYREVEHTELLELVGSRPSARRHLLYAKCRPRLSRDAAAFWDARPAAIARGIGGAGKFERYFETFRRRILPLVHHHARVEALLAPRDRAGRIRFYSDEWDTWRWRLLFRLFFSRTMMGRLGRDPEFFRYVEGDVAGRILDRTKHALTELDPSENPYVHWILTGTHGAALPCALREESFAPIRANLDRLEWRQASLEDFLTGGAGPTFDRFNLSDLFEYVSLDHYHRLLGAIVGASRPHARLAYWNMLAPRERPTEMAGMIAPLSELAGRLHRRDRAFFYSAFRLEEVVAQLDNVVAQPDNVVTQPFKAAQDIQ
jgi:S-adenosylmethionine-diacylglycerol 3-amino-3-carboxypropyl transferase